MSRQARAAICRELNKPVVVEEISVDPPKAGEVTVKLAACGVCHSDLSATNGTLAMPLPLVLGHEAAGEVVETGAGVTGLKEGDHVVSSFIYMCGECRFCVAGRPVLCVEQGKAITTLPDGTVRTRDARGQPLNVFSGCGVMAEYATLHKDNVVKIDPKIPLDRAALVGCAVTTGVGAVFNTARVAPGSTFAVLNTAPTPVVTAQPTSAARSNGIFGSILTRLSTCMVAYSAITPQPEKMLSGWPLASRVRTVPSGSVVIALPCSIHSTGRPAEQNRHLPHI